MSSGFNRRDFSKAAVTAAAASAASTLAPARVLGAGDQVRLGFIGVGNRGYQLLKGFLAHPDAKIVALCDVYAPYLNAEYDKVDPQFAGLGQRIPRMAELPADVARVKDFRTVLDRPDIDAVVIATPDHWHAIPAGMVSGGDGVRRGWCPGMVCPGMVSDFVLGSYALSSKPKTKSDTAHRQWTMA